MRCPFCGNLVEADQMEPLTDHSGEILPVCPSCYELETYKEKP